MANTQIIIDATDTNNQPVKKTITDINPAATNAQLATFGNMLNQLTDNVYGKTTKITKVHCDAEAGGGDTRPVPTLKLCYYDSPNNIVERLPFSTLGDNNPGDMQKYFPIVYNGDATELFFEFDPLTWNVRSTIANVANGVPPSATGLTDMTIDGIKVKYFVQLEHQSDAAFTPVKNTTVTLRVPETDNYKAASFTFAIYDDQA